MAKRNMSVPKQFQATAKKHPQKPCILFEDQTWTFKQIDEFSDRVAWVFWEAGFRRGDVVALFQGACPQYACIWLGLAKIGVVTALVNYNLRNQPLLHSIKVAKPKAVIFGTELTEAMEEIVPSLDADIPVKYFYIGSGKTPTFPASYLDNQLENCSNASKPLPAVNTQLSDCLFYIYTSGTTGLPKAAIVTHYKFCFTANAIAIAARLQPDDVIYNSLPLYHNNGVVLGIGQPFLLGNTVVLKRKFSASQFWKDCVHYKCTVALYIGEICRYLLAQPPKPEDQSHSVRTIYGNGLRPQIWEEFVERFRIKRVGEFYGVTEGNVSLSNLDNTVGAVGFLLRFLSFLYPCTLIKVDEKTGLPVRDSQGLCIKCQPGEAGELVGKILQQVGRHFDGYTDKNESKKKIIHDVFKKGDMAFTSGDVLVMDRFGYLYFKDRRGDTFRWKGENVSTTEVEAVISNALGLKDCIVFGAHIPGFEGKAGMAAILDPEHSLNLEHLSQAIQKSLPSYARPLFVRIMTTLPMTGTYKFKKAELQENGFDPAKCNGCKLYFFNGSQYCPLDTNVYKEICNGKMRL